MQAFSTEPAYCTYYPTAHVTSANGPDALWMLSGDNTGKCSKHRECLCASVYDPDYEDEDSSGTPPIAAIAGGAAAAILLMLGLIFLYLRKKRTAGSQPAIALTAISLTTIGRRLSGRLFAKEKDLEGGATRKTTTYSVELTKTPMGLGLSLTEEVVTEIKSDSQAARNGRIKVGDRVVTVNGEAPTKAKPSSTILQATGVGTIVKLEFTSEPITMSFVDTVDAEIPMGILP